MTKINPSSPVIQTSPRGRTLVATGLLLLLFIGIIGVALDLRIAPAETKQGLTSPQGVVDQPTVIAQRDFGAWSYSAVRSTADGLVHPTVRFDQSSASGLRAYAAANKALASEIAHSPGSASVIITFAQLLQVEQFRRWAASYSLNIEVISFRTVGPNGVRGSIGVMPEKGDTLPKVVGPHEQIKGIFGVSAKIAQGQLPALAADPLVFLADVTRNVIEHDLRALNIPDGQQSAVVYLGSPFWHMEDLGLVTDLSTPLPDPIPTIGSPLTPP